MRLLALSLVVLVGACQPAPPQMTDAERSEIEAAVTEGLETWLEGANTLDAALGTSMVDPEADFVDFGTHYQNRADLREGWAGSFSRFQSWDSAWDDVQIDVIRTDLALFFGRFTLSRRYLDGRLQESSPYIWITGRFELSETGWKLTHGHLSGAVRIVEDDAG